MSEFSDFLRHSSFIRSYTAISSGQEKGIIYVEDATDRTFWEKIVNFVCPGRYEIKPFGSPGVEGKRKLEMEYAHLHKERLVAVDGDFDYSCPARNNYSVHLIQNPFVLHTFYYSRESFINTREAILHLIDSLYLHVVVVNKNWPRL